MSREWRRPLAWSLALVVFALTVVYVIAAFRGALDLPAGDPVFMLVPTVTAAAALLILHPRPANPIGWLLMVWGLGTALSGVVELALSSVGEAPATVDLWLWLTLWSSGWSWVLFIFPIFHLLLVFPTGRLLTRRWRWLVGLEVGMLGVFLALTALSAQFARSEGETTIWTVANPIGVIPGEYWEGTFSLVWSLGLVVLALGSASAVIIRYRRGRTEEREQIKWLAYAAALFAVLYSVPALLSGGELPVWLDILFGLSIFAIPIAIAIAVLRFRLYDIDVVISRTLVYGALGLFMTVVYVAIVVGLGDLLGSGDEPDTALSIAATALVAIAFQPVRRQLQQVANRLVYGRRATPYEVLSDFSRRLSATDENLLDQVVRSLAAGTSAEKAAVWVRSGERIERTRVWPPGGAAPDPVPLEADEVPGADRTAWVVHDGERLGALTLTLARGQRPTPTDEQLLTELAAGIGLALRNAALTRNLRDRVEELRESRRRIVATQDETRRRLERDLHDGAQQQLVALKVKLSLARRLAAGAGASRTSEVLDGLNVEAESAIESMREMARGIYPPLLEAEGLVPAMTALARKAPLPVSVDAGGIGRYPHQVESSVYFCVLEALQNTVRHARARSAHIALSEEGDELSFSVSDDGTGFILDSTLAGGGLTNIADRIDALGGELQITGGPSAGTRITCRIPARALVPS